MKKQTNNKNKKISELTKLTLAIENKIYCFFIEEKFKIKNKTIFNILGKNNSIKIKEKVKIKKLKYIQKDSIINGIIILLLISIIFRLSCLNSIIYKYSMVTLKVSQSGIQKIFSDDNNQFSKPNEIWIDNITQSLNNSYDLNSLNIVNLIWTEDISNCAYMFKGCDSISEINFTNFDATKCTSTDFMFKGCISLKTLDLSGFITSNLLNTIANMFWDCKSLISLNLSTFDISQVINFGHMFCNCESLKWVDISSFKSEKGINLDNMFNGCKSITNINLSNFYTSQMENIQNMFDGCKSLKILDFPNLDLTSVTNEDYLKDIFLNCNNFEYINIKDLKSNISLENTFFEGTPNNLIVCINNNIELIKNIIDNNSCMLISCNGNLINYKYKLNKDGCFIENCSFTNYKYEFQNRCYEECPTNSKQRENYEELEGFDLDKKYFCKPICNETFPFEIIPTQECAKNCDINNIKNELCILNNQGKGNSEIFDNLLKNVEDIFTSNDYDTSDIEKGNNDIIKFNHMIITLTTTKNQQNNEKYGNETTINLGGCEIILKKVYNISNNEPLFMKKIDVIEEGMMIPKIEYDVYYKLNGINLIKLNLSYCSNSKIDISIPLNISDNIDKYNSSSGYYNDICYTSTSDDIFDIPLKDRKIEFINNNRTVCQEDCIFSEYDYNINKVKCSCEIKESSSIFKNIKIDKQKLFNSFIDIKNIANIHILVCFEALFSKKGIVKNYGSYFIMSVILIHLILIIVFYVNNFYNKLKNIIKEISLGIDIINSSKLQDKKMENKNELKINNYNIEKKNIIYNQKVHRKKNMMKIKLNSKKNLTDKKYRKFKFNNIDINPQSNEIIIAQRAKNKFNEKHNKIKNKDKVPEPIKKLMSYSNEELNNLEYKLALKFDKRKYCEYYFSLLKSKHALIFTFCNNTDYNSKIIKIDLLLFNITLFFTVNAIFFNDDTMHKIYINKGSFDIIGQLPQIIYSSLISMLFSAILELLALTEGIILELKNVGIGKKFNSRIKGLYNKIKIKFLLYFILSTIFLLLFWYYLSMFCAIYSNTQIHLIKDSLISLIISLIEPFAVYLIPGIFRIPALTKNGKKYILYKFSRILQMILI